VAAAAPNATDKVPSLTGTSPRTKAILERVAYVACGALVALLAAYVGLRPSKSTPAAATAAASQPVATPLAPAPNLEPPALVNEPEPTTFDAELGGRNAAKVSRECFAPERTA